MSHGWNRSWHPRASEMLLLLWNLPGGPAWRPSVRSPLARKCNCPCIALPAALTIFPGRLHAQATGVHSLRIECAVAARACILTTAKNILAGGLIEQEAIDRAKQGDAESFEALYGLHKRRVYSLCLRMTGNVAETEDLTQEAFLQVYRKIGTFRGESAFSTWLHRLTVNIVLMHLRKKVMPEVSLEETLEPPQEDGPTKEVGTCDNVLAGSIDRVNLQRSIERLPSGYRIVFVLHDVEGYEHNEIARMMGCSIGNSKSQLHKARMKLRELLRMSQAERAAKR